MHDSLRPFSIFSSGGHFVKSKGTILAILVKGHKRNISVKLLARRDFVPGELMLSPRRWRRHLSVSASALAQCLSFQMCA